MKIFSVIINVCSLFVFCLLINKEISSTTFTFPTATTLTNGNIIVIEKTGIYIYDPTLSTLEDTVLIFSEEDQIKTTQDLSRVAIKRFKGYFVSLINYKIYIFSGEGSLLYYSTKFYNQELEYYSLVPFFLNDNYFAFIIGFFDSNTYLCF